MCYNLNKEKMMSDELERGTWVSNPDSGDKGYVMGPFWRKGEKWWTISWEQAGTEAHREADIT